MKSFLLPLLGSAVLITLASAAHAQSQKPKPNRSAADTAWTDLAASVRQPGIPNAVMAATANASPADRLLIKRQRAAAQAGTAESAKAFYTQYANHPKAGEARKLEALSRIRAALEGDAAQEPEARRVSRAFRQDMNVPAKDRFEVARAVNDMKLRQAEFADGAKAATEREAHARGLLGEFTDLPEAKAHYWGVARTLPPAKTRAMAREIMSMTAPAPVKLEASRWLERDALIGKPLSFGYLDENNNERTLAEHHGKPVIIYVWTRQGRASLDMITKLQQSVPTGTVLLGVNADQDVAESRAFAAEHKLPGVLIYDARGLSGSPCAQLKALQVPSLYIIDRQGGVADLGGMEKIDQKIFFGTSKL